MRGTESVESFVDHLDIVAPRDTGFESATLGAADIAAIESAPLVTVGSNLVEFADSTPVERRGAVMNAILLAQLAANKQTADATPEQWYNAHHGVLQQLGWSQSAFSLVNHDLDDVGADVHSAILPLVTAAFAPGAAIPALIIKTLEQLKEMDKDNPWITLYDRESRRFDARQFQLSYAEGTADEQRVTLLGFNLNAEKIETQVLFFRTSEQNTSFQKMEGTLSIDADLLQSTADKLAAKLKDHVVDYLSSVEI